MTVVLGERALGGGPDVGEDQSRACLWCDALEVDAIPSRKSGGEDTWSIAEVSLCVPADTEAVTVDGSAVVQAKAGIVRLGEN